MMFGMVFGWILILAVAVWALTTLFPSNRGARGPEHLRSPLDILNDRYARGEIGREEYETIVADIAPREVD